MNPPDGNFDNGVVWDTFVFKVPECSPFEQKLEIMLHSLLLIRSLSKILNPILTTIIVEDCGFRNMLTIQSLCAGYLLCIVTANEHNIR